MKITKLGIITALKNIGVFIGAYTVSGIKADPTQFMLVLGCYALISIPSDLYLLNKAHENGKAEG